MKHLVVIILLLLYTSAYAQKQGHALIDSLKSEIHKPKADTAQINLLNALGAAYVYNNPDSALTYVNRALRLAEKIGFKKGMASAYNTLSAFHFNSGNYKYSKENTDKGLAMALKTGDSQVMFDAYNNNGYCFFFQANYSEALKNNYTALKIAERIGDKKNLANAYICFGLIYYGQKNYSDALKNYFTALKLSKEIDNWFCTGLSCTSIAIIYFEQGKYPESLQFHSEALKIYEKDGNILGKGYGFSNIGEVYARMGNYPEALKNSFIAIGILNKIGDKILIADVYNNIGFVYTRLKQFTNAKRYLDSALLLSKEGGSVEFIKMSYENLSLLNKATNNWQSALQNHKLFIFYRDSMVNKEHTSKTIQASMQYDFDKKESAAKVIQDKKDALANEEAQWQRNIRNSAGGSLAIVALFSIVVYRQRNKILKEKKRSDELLLNILPSEVAEELKAKGSAEAKQFDEVTVMFTDFKDFTLITEKLSPAALVAEIHHCFTTFDNIVTKYNIEKIKTIGHSYMCVGGLPVANKTNAEDVVNAALEIQHFMQEYINHKNTQGKEPFELRIGIHTGPVVAGIVGVKKFAYDIWGDTVNIASRMEASGETGKVNISQRTYELVKDSFTCTYRGKIAAKNKGEIDMYFAESSIS